MQVKGSVVQVFKPESGVSRAGKDWKKQEFLVETAEQFPKKICFSLFGDKTALLDGISEGQEVEVFFSVESHDFNGKWYHNINAWKIDRIAETSPGSYPPEQVARDISPERMEEPGNDLPF
jgi:hypothetical protein